MFGVLSKPIDVSPEEDANELDTGGQGDYKGVEDHVDDVTKLGEVPSPSAGLSNEKMTSSEKRIPTVTSSTVSPEIRGAQVARERLANPENGVSDNTSNRQQGFAWVLTPFNQKLQFSPQAFFQDKIVQLKDTLTHLGSILPNQPDDSKQFGNAGLVNLVGLNDSGFYTDRLDPAGFFGGNGWFANKGGILGGPGAIISTGSLFTDYPTPYRK